VSHPVFPDSFANLPLLVDEYVQPFAGAEHHRFLRVVANHNTLRFHNAMLDVFPPQIQMRTHLSDDLWMDCRHVVVLMGIGL
jgi:hypothetical protein